MAFGAAAAATKGVVQQDEVSNQLVLVRGDIFAKHAEGCIAIALRHVPQHLVVGPILLDNMYNVPDKGGLAGELRYLARRLTGPGRQAGRRQQRITNVVQRGVRQPLELVRVRDRDQRD